MYRNTKRKFHDLILSGYEIYDYIDILVPIIKSYFQDETNLPTNQKLVQIAQKEFCKLTKSEVEYFTFLEKIIKPLLPILKHFYGFTADRTLSTYFTPYTDQQRHLDYQNIFHFEKLKNILYQKLNLPDISQNHSDAELIDIVKWSIIETEFTLAPISYYFENHSVNSTLKELCLFVENIKHTIFRVEENSNNLIDITNTLVELEISCNYAQNYESFDDYYKEWREKVCSTCKHRLVELQGTCTGNSYFPYKNNTSLECSK